MKAIRSINKSTALLLAIVCLYTIATVGQSSAVGDGTASKSATSAQSTVAGSQSRENDNPGRPQVMGNVRVIDPPAATKAAEVPGRMEDWNTLKVPDDLKVADPMPPQKGQLSGYTREFVQLTWRPWDIVELYVIKPDGIKNPPVILYLYSFPSDTDRFKDEEFAKIATRNGFAAVGFVSALTGYRFHDRPMKEWFVSELQEALGTSVHDVQLILNYLKKRGDLDMTRVGMFGDGSGAAIAVLAASVDPRIQALDLFDPWGDWPDWLAHSSLITDEKERETYLKPEFLKKVENLDPVKYLSELKTPHVRVRFLDSNPITPKAARERIEATAPHDAKIIHYENPKAFLEATQNMANMFDWLAQQVVTPVGAEQPGTATPEGATTSRAVQQ